MNLSYFSVTSPKPGCLCAASSVLCCEDRSSNPRIVFWMDSSTNPAKPLETTNVTHTQLSKLEDMTCVVNTTRRLLVACSSDTVEVHDGKADRLLWKVSGKLPGVEKEIRPSSVDTNDKDTVFICDTANACVHTFTFSGYYLGCLIRKGQGIGCPLTIRYDKANNSSKSLFILNAEEDGKLYFSEAKISQPTV